MSKVTFANLIWMAADISLALLLLPTILFLFTGWRIRRDKLIAYLSCDALSLYYNQFPWKASAEPDLKKRFTKQFNFLYGCRHFLMPLTVFVAIGTTALWLGVRSIQAKFDLGTSALRLPDVTLFAMAGGFVWVINDQLSRIARRDLSPRDIYGWTFRILLAIPFGVSLAALATPALKDAIAFLLGCFPTQTLFTIGRRIVANKLTLDDQQDGNNIELAMLQCVSREKAETFQDQGVDTVAALAWADPIDLTIRTNFDFNYVLDCMSQALLWVYFQEKTRLLYTYSLRGSQETLTLVMLLSGTLATGQDGPVRFDPVKAGAALGEMASVVGMTENSFRTTLDQVAADPYTQFIAKVWH
ncbi:MAG: hypothetical protein WB524_13550 [Acidobacteriaceae bacterium]